MGLRDDPAPLKQIIRELVFQKVLKTTPGKTRDRKSCVFVVPGDGSAPVPPTGAE